MELSERAANRKREAAATRCVEWGAKATRGRKRAWRVVDVVEGWQTALEPSQVCCGLRVRVYAAEGFTLLASMSQCRVAAGTKAGRGRRSMRTGW